MNPLQKQPLHQQPLFRAARQILRKLNRPSNLAVTRALSAPMQHLLGRQARVDQAWRLTQMAERRGWTLAAHRLRSDLFREAGFLQSPLAELREQKEAPVDPPNPISWTSMIDELRQLQEEFAAVEFRLREKIVAAHTEPIELNGVSLGPFAIELHLTDLHHRADSSSFACVAREPNPASSDPSVTHPHVRDAGLCAGDATVPIATALAQGRICDAFCLVRSVLQEYNAQSPYVSLDAWNGERCHDCERVTGTDDLWGCAACGHDVCDDCHHRCAVCDASVCRSCMSYDPVSDRDCCPECHQTCDACGRTVDSDSFVDEALLCPACEAERLRQEEPDPPTPKPDVENDHDNNTPDSPQAEPAACAGGENVDGPVNRRPSSE